MSDNDRGTTEAPTRREYVKYGGAVVGGGLFAGCIGGGGGDGESGDSSGGSDNGGDNEGSYTVEMFPVGEVEFEEVPETWNAESFDAWGDIAVTLGQADGGQSPLSTYPMWYSHLGIEYNSDSSSIWREEGIDKESLYELNPDVFLIDPNNLIAEASNFDEADADEIKENVAPFFGCYNRTVTAGYQLEMGYPEKAPDMMEATEKMGEVFQQQERAQAMIDLHAEVQDEIDSRLEGVEPAEIGLVGNWNPKDSDEFFVQQPTVRGFGYRQYRNLNVIDAFEDEQEDVAFSFTTDYEGLLEADPDHLVVYAGIFSNWWDTDFGEASWDPEIWGEYWIETLEKHPVGQELTAVQNGNIHPGATNRQGPIIHLFQIEFLAQNLYPEQFGEFPVAQYPEVPEENQLFDRQRVADIVNGEF